MKVLVVVLALFAGAAFGRSKPSTFTDFIGKAKPGDGKGQEVVGPIDDFECVYNGAFAYPESCDLYVDCWEGAATLFRCTDNMLFDLRYLGCEFAQYVDCQDRPRPTNVPSTLTPPVSTTTTNYSTTTTPAPDGDFTCPNDGVFAHEEKCEYYWSCFAGTATLIHCQLEFLFDLVYMGCNYPELTHCQDRERPGHYPGTSYKPISTTSTTAAPTTTEGPTTTAAPTTTGPTTTAAPTTTGPTTTAAPTTTDPTITAAPTTTGPTTVRTTTEGGGEFVCPSDGFFADPKDCSMFYQCAFGEASHQQCPDGLFFNPKVDACDFPINVDCEDRNRTIPRHH